MQRTKKDPLLLTEKNTSDIFFFLHLEVVVTLESSLLSNDVSFAKSNSWIFRVNTLFATTSAICSTILPGFYCYPRAIFSPNKRWHLVVSTLGTERERKWKKERESKTFFSVAGKSFAPYNYLKLAVILFPTILSLQFFIQLLLIIFLGGSVIINVLRDPVRKLTHTNDERARLLDHFCVNGT